MRKPSGGVEDDEFTERSCAFFEQVHEGRFMLTVSAVVAEETSEAPRALRDFFDHMLPYAEMLDVSSFVQRLQQVYLDAGILTPKWEEDALHVALATVHECELIVSWNFRHIVHFQKIRKSNAVNTLHGYRTLAIHSPPEVIFDAEDNS